MASALIYTFECTKYRYGYKANETFTLFGEKSDWYFAQIEIRWNGFIVSNYSKTHPKIKEQKERNLS